MNKLKNNDSNWGILFLQGVFKKDCKRIEDIFHDKLLDKHNITKYINEKKVYDKIPVLFTIINSWPKSTNLLCWNCSRTFNTIPWFEPQSIEPATETIAKKNTNDIIINNKKIIIGVKGNFCSCNCVMSHINLYSKDISEKLNKIMMLKVVYEIFNNGKTISDIKISPAHTEMIQYGGTYTEQEYQKKIEQLDHSYKYDIEYSSMFRSSDNDLLLDNSFN